MRLIPGIDLRGGRLVRLVRGELAEESVYEASPDRYAAMLVEAGARYLHVVDLGAGSYTHLTLPTIHSVSISVAAASFIKNITSLTG